MSVPMRGGSTYTDAFIAVSPDCPALFGSVPKARTIPSVAELEHQLLVEHPYTFTHEALIFAVQTRRMGLDEPGAQARTDELRPIIFARPHACLRASALVKTYGWGVHFDEQGRVALYGRESDEYASFVARADLTQFAGMRRRRG